MELRRRFRPALAVLAVATCAGAAAAQSVSIEASRDATAIAGTELTDSAGARLVVGKTSDGVLQHAFVEFDVASAVPAGAQILAARLVLHVAADDDGAATRVDVRRAAAAWGDAANLTEPAPRASASKVVERPGKAAFGPTPAMVSDVQSWLDEPPGNHGWMLTPDTTAPPTVKRFASLEGEDAASRPSLIVDFIAPGERRTDDE